MSCGFHKDLFQDLFYSYYMSMTCLNTYSLLKFNLFAYDTNLFFSRKSLGLLESALNQELRYIAEWMKVNRLGLNVSKTNFILFHSCKLKLNQSFSVKIDIYLSLSTGIE